MGQNETCLREIQSLATPSCSGWRRRLRAAASLSWTHSTGDGPHLKKGIDVRTLRNLIALALRRHVRHRPLQSPEVGDLLSNIPKMFVGDRVDLRAGEGGPVNQAEQVTQLVEAEAGLRSGPWPNNRADAENQL
jgi:hypothetical protein